MTYNVLGGTLNLALSIYLPFTTNGAILSYSAALLPPCDAPPPGWRVQGRSAPDLIFFDGEPPIGASKCFCEPHLPSHDLEL